jgi:acyl-CoA reductase-like NAD-dependent aldehyde dehydrogenase
MLGLPIVRQPRPMPPPDRLFPDPVILVHSLGHAVAALKAAAAARRRIVLASAPDAGSYAGAGWFRALAEAAREAVPQAQFSAVLDCGDAAGPALAALRSQIDGVIFTGRADVARRLAEIALQHGAHLFTARPARAFDLGADYFALDAALVERCVAFLSPADTAGGSGYATRS